MARRTRDRAWRHVWDTAMPPLELLREGAGERYDTLYRGLTIEQVYALGGLIEAIREYDRAACDGRQ